MDTTIAAVVTIVFALISSVIGYLVIQRDKQRIIDITKLETQITATAKLVLEEKEKTAKLVLEEKEKTANLVLSERDKMIKIFQDNYDKLDDKFNEFRLKVTAEYATQILLEKVLKPISAQLEKIVELLPTKLDRRDFDEHRAKFDKS